MASTSSLQLKVSRSDLELVTPSKPTPLEIKHLSNIDDQETFRFQSPFIHSYSTIVEMTGKDPVKVIREAVANALVFYYPFAGRLRKTPGRKLLVHCNGEGVGFIEANANVRLDQFGDTLLPPSPWLDDLLYDAPGTVDVLNCPLLTFQVTRLMCGGFIFAFRYNHVMCDGVGVIQFINAVAEMARGASTPSVRPAWGRELLTARDPHDAIMCDDHREYNEMYLHRYPIGIYRMVHRNFFFSSQDIAALKNHLPSYLRKCSSFDILTACLWRSRVLAHNLSPDDKVQLILTIDVRRTYRPQLPNGYYGNALALPSVFTTAEKLCQNPLSYSVELVKNAKSSVTDEYMRSLMNLMAMKRQPGLLLDRTQTFMVSDLAYVGLGDINFGWGKAVYAGPAASNYEVISPFIRFRNKTGVDGRLVPIALPGPTMEKFEMEVRRMIRETPSETSPLRNKL